MPKFSISAWFGFPVPIEERFKMIKAAGFNGVLLWWGDEQVAGDGDKSLQPELARKNGLFIENIHAPFTGINCLWTDSLAGDEFERILAKCLVECAEYQIPTAILHVSQGNNPPLPNQTGLDRIKRLVEIAERKNINIALENLRRLECLKFIFSNIQSDRLGLCYDSGHENSYTKGTDLLTEYRSKLLAVHLHDNNGTDDLHQIPGEGSIDWGILIKKLKKAEYTGSIALEVTNTFSKYGDIETPEWFLRRTFKAAKEIFKL